MNNPVTREQFEERIRSWVDRDPVNNLQTLRSYMETHNTTPNASYKSAGIDIINECLWTYAHSRSKLWAMEGLDDLVKEISDSAGA